MKLAFTAAFLALIQLTVAQDFVYRFYNNGGCNHTSSAANTFPPFPAPPSNGSYATCINSPQGGLNWDHLEYSTSRPDNAVQAFVFCNKDCQGADIQVVGNACTPAPPNCLIGSFIGFPA